MAPKRLQRRLSPRALAGAALSGLLYALAEPPLGLWPLVGVCWVPLLLALRGRGPWARIGLASLTGGSAALVVGAGPIGFAASGFLDAPIWQGLAITTLTSLGFGCGSFVIFGALCGDPERLRPSLAALRCAGAFAIAEYARSTLFTGFPWLLAAHALAPRPELAQLAAWGGSWLLGAWLVAWNASLAVLLAPGQGRGEALAGALVLAGLAGAAAIGLPAAGTPGPGAVQVAAATSRDPGAKRVLLVQPSFDLALWYDPLRARDAVGGLVELSRRESRGRLDLIVWPENAVKGLLPANRSLVEEAARKLAPTSPQLLFGAPRYPPEEPARRYNSAQLVDREGRALGIHDKVRLVPYFETPVLGFGSPEAKLSPGGAPRVLPWGDLHIGPLVCYEVLFSYLARQQVLEGAELLVNVSNDAWFGGSGGAEQHFAAAVLLAIQLRRPVLRSTTTGISAAIDAYGRVVARLPMDATGALRVDVWPATERSGYARIGNAVPWLGLALSLALGRLAGPRRADA